MGAALLALVLPGSVGPLLGSCPLLLHKLRCQVVRREALHRARPVAALLPECVVREALEALQAHSCHVSHAAQGQCRPMNHAA